MSQVVKVEPETLFERHFAAQEQLRSSIIGTPEHASLIDAIKLNFPEIYDDPVELATDGKRGESRPRSSAVSSPPCEHPD